MKSATTFQAQIYVGLRPGYHGPVHPVSHAVQIVHAYCDQVGWGLTVTPTTFVYTGGSEPGVIVGVIQYPRFPMETAEIIRRTMELARRLLKGLDQERLTVVMPGETIMIEKEDLKE